MSDCPRFIVCGTDDPRWVRASLLYTVWDYCSPLPSQLCACEDEATAQCIASAMERASNEGAQRWREATDTYALEHGWDTGEDEDFHIVDWAADETDPPYSNLAFGNEEVVCPYCHDELAREDPDPVLGHIGPKCLEELT